MSTVNNQTNITGNELSFVLNSKNPLKELYSKNGFIHKKNFFYKILSFFGWIKKESNQAMKERIDFIVNEIFGDAPEKYDHAISKERIFKYVKNDPEKNANLVTSIFLNKVGQFYNSTKDDQQISTINQFKSQSLKAIAQYSSEYIQNSQKTTDIRKLINDETNQETILKLRNELLENKTKTKAYISKILYAVGEVGKSEKGTTGTSLVFGYRKDGTKKLLGVFKPDSQHSPLSVRVKNFFKRFQGQLSLLSNRAYAQPKAERIAYEASLFFGLNSVPPSVLVNIGTTKGVFQLAVQTVVKTQEGENKSTKNIKLQEAKDFMQPDNNLLIDPKRDFKEAEVEIFQRFALLDFLIGNLDCHEENWFINLKDNSQEISHIVAIDKANSFPRKNSKNSKNLKGKNQYKWKIIPIADKPFTENMKKFMRGFTEENVNQFIIQTHKQHPDFLDPEMEKLLKQRGEAIRKIAENEKGSPAELGRMTTDCDFIV